MAEQIEALEQTKNHTQTVVTASECGTHTRVQMISDDDHHTRAWTVRVVRVIPTLTAGMGGCACYWQRLATVTVSLIRTLSTRL